MYMTSTSSDIQSQTMKTMYKILAHEIKAMNLDAHPQDYLNFYCLGKREELPTEMSQAVADVKVL